MKIERMSFAALASLMIAFAACTEEPRQPEPEPEPDPQPQPVVVTKPTAEIRQADIFATDLFETYYLWSKEISKDIPRLDPDTCKIPISVVHDIRYHESGKEVDHWTVLTDDLSSMTSSVQGLGLTYGYDFQIGNIANKSGTYFLLVTYVVKGLPAEKAGLKRGDVILTLDGKDITRDNYYDAFNSASVKVGISHIENRTIGAVEKEVEMTAVDTWENPVLLDTTFVIGSKKVGYLVYNSFDLMSGPILANVFREFKAEGINELILDLRYNGGGYTFTEGLLASLIAPPANVKAGDVFQTEVYNDVLSRAWKSQGYDSNTYFSTKHDYEGDNVSIHEDVSDANPGVDKLYVIVSGGSASASEGLIVGLGPYMDITLIGQQTYGKYCGGYMMSPEAFYGSSSTAEYSRIKKWGMYVMTSKFADKNGKNAAQPDGIPVDIEAYDIPYDGYQLGDQEETMLSAALKAAGKTGTRAGVSTHQVFPLEIVDHRAPRGILVKTELPGPLPTK